MVDNTSPHSGPACPRRADCYNFPLVPAHRRKQPPAPPSTCCPFPGPGQGLSFLSHSTGPARLSSPTAPCLRSGSAVTCSSTRVCEPCPWKLRPPRISCASIHIKPGETGHLTPGVIRESLGPPPSIPSRVALWLREVRPPPSCSLSLFLSLCRQHLSIQICLISPSEMTWKTKLSKSTRSSEAGAVTVKKKRKDPQQVRPYFVSFKKHTNRQKGV